MAGREKNFWGVFTYFGYARSKTALDFFFETKNIFIFEAGPNFGRGQKWGFTLYNGILAAPNCPKLPKMSRKDEK